MAHVSTQVTPNASPPLKLSSGAAARLAELSETTLRRMVERGELNVTRTPGGHRRYDETEIRALATGGAA